MKESDTSSQENSPPKNDHASLLWQSYQGKKLHTQQRTSGALYIGLGFVVFAIVCAGLWIVVFK